MTKFLLNSYIKDFDNEHIKAMQDKLFTLGVLSKDYPKENLILLYNKYSNENKAPLELECRSVVINRDNFQIENYSIFPRFRIFLSLKKATNKERHPWNFHTIPNDHVFKHKIQTST